MLQRRTASAVKDVGSLALTEGPWKERAEKLASGLKEFADLGDSQEKATVAVSVVDPEGLQTCKGTLIDALRLNLLDQIRSPFCWRSPF
jgi:hypothetical protein